MSWAMIASACAVLPRPMSSARIPPRSLASSHDEPGEPVLLVVAQRRGDRLRRLDLLGRRRPELAGQRPGDPARHRVAVDLVGRRREVEHLGGRLVALRPPAWRTRASRRASPRRCAASDRAPQRARRGPGRASSSSSAVSGSPSTRTSPVSASVCASSPPDTPVTVTRRTSVESGSSADGRCTAIPTSSSAPMPSLEEVRRPRAGRSTSSSAGFSGSSDQARRAMSHSHASSVTASCGEVPSRSAVSGPSGGSTTVGSVSDWKRGRSRKCPSRSSGALRWNRSRAPALDTGRDLIGPAVHLGLVRRGGDLRRAEPGERRARRRWWRTSRARTSSGSPSSTASEAANQTLPIAPALSRPGAGRQDHVRSAVSDARSGTSSPWVVSSTASTMRAATAVTVTSTEGRVRVSQSTNFSAPTTGRSVPLAGAAVVQQHRDDAQGREIDAGVAGRTGEPLLARRAQEQAPVDDAHGERRRERRGEPCGCGGCRLGGADGHVPRLVWSDAVGPCVPEGLRDDRRTAHRLEAPPSGCWPDQDHVINIDHTTRRNVGHPVARRRPRKDRNHAEGQSAVQQPRARRDAGGARPGARGVLVGRQRQGFRWVGRLEGVPHRRLEGHHGRPDPQPGLRPDARDQGLRDHVQGQHRPDRDRVPAARAG